MQFRSICQDVVDLVMAAKWGQARIEVLSVRNHIESRLEQGYPVQQIFVELKDLDKISINKSAFHVHVRRLRKEIPSAVSPSLPIATPTSEKIVHPHVNFSTPHSNIKNFNHSPEASEKTISEIWGDDS